MASKIKVTQIRSRIGAQKKQKACLSGLGLRKINNFSVLDVENLRLHYARTLELWLARYDEASNEVVRMFDPVFTRAWRLYLCGSIAGFLHGSLQVFQVLFARGQDNTIPWSRQHQYLS